MKNSAAKHEDLSVAKYLRPMGVGLGFGLAVSLFLMIIFSLVMSAKDIPQSVVMPLAMISVLAGCFLSGFISAKLARERGLILGLCCGVVILLLMCLASSAVVQESFGVLFLAKGLLVLLVSIGGGVLGVNHKRKRK